MAYGQKQQSSRPGTGRAGLHVSGRTLGAAMRPRWRDDRGASMVEYGLLIAFAMLVAFGIIAIFGQQVVALFESVDTEFGEVYQGPGGA